MAQEAREISTREIDGVSLPPAGTYEFDMTHTHAGSDPRPSFSANKHCGG